MYVVAYFNYLKAVAGQVPVTKPHARLSSSLEDDRHLHRKIHTISTGEYASQYNSFTVTPADQVAFFHVALTLSIASLYIAPATYTVSHR